MKRAGPALLAAALLAACPGQGPGVLTGGPCDEANERLGLLACVHDLTDRELWEELSLESVSADQQRITKHLVPMIGTDTELTPLLANANAFELHSEFLREAFPDEFKGLDQSSYAELILGVDRPFASGHLIELQPVGDAPARWAFHIWDYPNQPDTTVTLDQAATVFEGLSPMIEALSDEPLAFQPTTANQVAAAATWAAPFEVLRLAELDYEAYNPGVGFGTLRLVDVAELEALEEEGALGWQDIVAFDEAPFDLERVTSGVVTGSRQTGLSHLNVRATARGTPNCYQADVHELLAPYGGLLVRLECDEDQLRIRTATAEEAQAFWDELRPDPVDVVAPDLDTQALVPLLELPTRSAAHRQANVAAYGSKGAWLGVLYQRIPAQEQLEGFVVPMSAYATFMAQPWEGGSFQDAVDAWFADPDFLADPALRRARLGELRSAMEDAPVDEALLIELSDQIEAQWGGDTVMVRFRSSSNAEDALEFSGAGLYDSTSACVADEWDDDEAGPSRCDPAEPRERSLSRALRKVWASTWNMAAVEERAWYGIDTELVAMGVLVNTRSEGELAEAVAFSGDPALADDRVRIDAQWEEVGVVAPESGVVPEVIRVTVTEGRIEALEWEQASSELPGGQRVLSPSEAARIGLRIASLAELLPQDDEVPEGRSLLYDTEWKVLEDGRLVVKQVRPFLR